MPIPTQHRDSTRPFRLAHGPLPGYHETEAAAVDFCEELLFRGVKKRLVNELMLASLATHFPQAVPGDRLRAWLTEGDIDAKDRTKRVRAIDKTNDIDSQGVSHLVALQSVIRVLFKDFRIDTDCQEIDARWCGIIDGGPPEGVVTLPYGTNGSDKQVAALLVRHIGPVEPFVHSVHGKCKPKDLLQSFIACARFAPQRDKANALSESAELVQAILNLYVWHEKTEDTPFGTRSRQGRQRIEANPGIYKEHGIAYVLNENTSDMMLYVLPNAVHQHLPERFKRKRADEIKALLFAAPGYKKTTKEGYSCPNRVREALGNWRAIEINIRVFRESLDRTEATAANPPAEKQLDPDADGRDPAVIVTPYSAADNTSHMLAADPHASEPLRSAGSLPQANTVQQPSLTLLVSENPVSFRRDTLVSEADRDVRTGASVRTGENLSDSGWMESHGGSHK